MDFDKVVDKKYHFAFEPKKRPAGYAPRVVVPDDQYICFSPNELYSLRKAFKQYGKDFVFRRLEDIDDNLYEEMYEDLSDMLYSNMTSPQSNKELADEINKIINDFRNGPQTDADENKMEQELNKLVPYELEDYKVVFPDELINDVLDDNFLDWAAIEKEAKDSEREIEELLAKAKANKK